MVKALKTIGLWLGVTLLILLAGAVWVMLEYTLVNTWIFLGCILMISCVLTSLCHKLRRLPAIFSNKALNLITTTLILFVIISGATLTANYFTADFDHEPPTKAIIERKYQQTRHRSRRSGRHSYEQGESYQAYFVDLRLLSPADSTLTQNHTQSLKQTSMQGKNNTLKIELTRKPYSKIHKGDTATVSISKGILGLRVISPATLHPLHPHKAKTRHYGHSN